MLVLGHAKVQPETRLLSAPAAARRKSVAELCRGSACVFHPASVRVRLQAIAKHSGDVFIPRGVDVPALDRSISYEFAPQKVKVRRRSAL